MNDITLNPTNTSNNFDVVKEGEVIKPKRTINKTKIRIISIVVVLVIVVFIAIWLVQIFKTYKNASTYKKSYNIVQDQFRFCDSITGKEQKKEIFTYCDEYTKRFESVKK